MSHTTFESGKEYTLAQLFSGDNKIIIPDLQRDYCWGDKAWDLVSGFVTNLLDYFSTRNDNDKNVTMGVIYGYEHPRHHIQLCDGQQRLTTLYLLLGTLNRKTNNTFQKYLIPEEKEDKDPYLQYAIRESTLDFLSELVHKFFLEDNIHVDEIEKQDWYFSEYTLDASIQSMIAAIKTIEDELISVDCRKFGNFILNNLEIIYYDMGDRKRGEETFVIINTTGEPLTATENLKPILLGGLDNTKKEFPDKSGTPNQETKLEYHSRLWEDREEWFWNNKSAKETTADDGLNDFLVWYWQIWLLQEKTGKNRKALAPKELFSKKPQSESDNEDNPTLENWERAKKLDTVHKYFSALQKVIDIHQQEETATILKTIKNENIDLEWFRKSELYVILPLIVYMEKFHNTNKFHEFIRRIRRNFFDKKWERGHFVDWRHIVQIINFSDSEDDVFVYDTNTHKDKFKKIPNVELNEWYNLDEQNKVALKKDHKEEVEKYEDHADLMGDLTPFWSANSGKENTYDNINSIYNTFDMLYKCYDEEKCGKENITILSNYVRLYRVLIENVRIGHINRTSGMLGAWFSSRKTPSENNGCSYLKNKDIQSLWILKKSDEITAEIKQRIKEKIKQTDVELADDTFSSKKHLISWMLIKTLNAEKEGVTLSFRNDRGLASYDNCDANKINTELDFSLSNSICGYGFQSGGGSGNDIRYMRSNEGWGNPIEFDTLISNSISFDEFQNREENPILPEKIALIEDLMQELLNEFYDN
jgi:hypothetical protein